MFSAYRIVININTRVKITPNSCPQLFLKINAMLFQNRKKVDLGQWFIRTSFWSADLPMRSFKRHYGPQISRIGYLAVHKHIWIWNMKCFPLSAGGRNWCCYRSLKDHPVQFLHIVCLFIRVTDGNTLCRLLMLKANLILNPLLIAYSRL